VVITNITDDGWWEGELNGTAGWFPSNYVELLTDEEAQRVCPSFLFSPTFSSSVGLTFLGFFFFFSGLSGGLDRHGGRN